MKFSHFLKQASGGVRLAGVLLVGVLLTAPARGQTTEPATGTAVPLEAGKRPASLSAAPADAAAPKAPFELDPNLTPSALKARYPVQSITSLELANQALADVKSSRKQIETLFKQEEKACYKTFFANRCVASAKDRRRIALNEIRAIQVEAERFKRHEAVLKRDAALEKNRLKTEGDGTGKTPEQKRAESEAAFAKKTRDREAAQQNVIEKRARTERRRQKKAAEAAKRARQAPKPSASVIAPAASSPAASAVPPASTSASTYTVPAAK